MTAPDLALELVEAGRAIHYSQGIDALQTLEQQARRIARFEQFDTESIVDGLCHEARKLGDRETIEHIVRSGIADQTAFANGHGQARFAQSSTKPPPIRTRNVFEFLHAEFPPRELMLAPWLPVQGIAMVHAPRGGSKTHLALGTAWAVATGTGFLKWTAPQARRVLLLDGEMPRVALQERLACISRASTVQPENWDNLTIAAADDQDLGLPDLSTPDAQRTYYAPLVANADLVIVDNLSTLCRSIKENEADSWMPMQDWALALRRASKSVLFIHHGGKSGQQRGTSKKEDIADSVINLRKPPDYTPQDGARFEIHFEKTRGFHGPDAEPFEAKLVGEQWEIGPIKSGDDIESLKAMRAQGMTIRDIADRVGSSKSTIARKLGEAE